MLRDLIDLVAPPCCAICSRAIDGSASVCGACEAGLDRLTPVIGVAPGLDAVWSAGAYEGVARGLVGALKFARRLSVAEVAARRIAGSAPQDLLAGTVTPVPPSPLRARWRGFDPAHAIAAAVARQAELPFDPCLRRANGQRQVGRSRRARLADPPRVRAPRRVPASVLLVDDVTTTGATLSVCAAALHAAGARRVAAVTFAASR
jgi:predicted amidophosphoribosyltransferase